MTFVVEEDDASVSEVAVERWSQSIKADCWETRSVHLQLHYKSCVSLVDIVSSADSLRSSRNSVQALLESRYGIPSTLFNRGPLRELVLVYPEDAVDSG
jgi:hypothetical protein